jgi:hypothetical protein
MSGSVARLPGKRVAKEKAQEMLLHGIGNVLGYWFEDASNQQDVADLGMTEEEFGELLLHEADRIARLFGYDQAWSN